MMESAGEGFLRLVGKGTFRGDALRRPEQWEATGLARPMGRALQA